MWAFFIIAAITGLWAAKNYPKKEPEIVVTPKNPVTPPKRQKPVLRLVKAMKKAVAYPTSPMKETISLGANQTIAPLLDPGKLDEQAEQARITGNIIEADKLTKLANQVRAAIVKKYNTEPAFAAKVSAAKGA